MYYHQIMRYADMKINRPIIDSFQNLRRFFTVPCIHRSAGDNLWEIELPEARLIRAPAGAIST